MQLRSGISKIWSCVSYLILFFAVMNQYKIIRMTVVRLNTIILIPFLNANVMF